MTNETGDGTIKWMLRVVILGLAIIIALILNSCGTRKVQTDLSIGKVDAKEKIETERTEQAQTKDIKIIGNDIVKEKQAQRIEELYNENGQLIKRITSMESAKETDKSTSTTSSYTFRYKTFKQIVFKTITIRIKEKSKAIEVSNKSWSNMIGIVLIIAVIGLLALKWFKRI